MTGGTLPRNPELTQLSGTDSAESHGSAWTSLKTRFRRYVVRHRADFVVRKIAQYCRTYLNYFDNCDYDIAVNGELAVLEALRGSDIDVIFDVGANDGEWSAYAASLFPDATIHGFEIIPATHERLARRFAGMSRMVTNCVGLSNETASVLIRTYEGRSDIATMYSYPEQREHCVEVTGRVIRGDDYLADRGIDRIGFLKIDVEGAEMKVLEGFWGAIAAGKIAVIQFEYGSVNIVAGVLLKHLYDLLAASGYVVGKIYPTGVDFRAYVLADEDFRGPNYLAVRTDRTDLQSRLRAFPSTEASR